MNATAVESTGQIRYEPDETPPPPLALGLGLQYVLLSLSGIVITPAIVVRAADGGEAFLSWAVFSALCICGVSTVLQSVKVGRIGAGYVLLMGTSGAFIAVSVAALQAGGPGLLATLIVASALVQFVMASRLSLLRRFITPTVAGTVMMLIAVTVMPIVFEMLRSQPEGTPPAAGPASALATLATSVLIALRARRSLTLWAPTIGVVAGCLVAAYFGLYNTAAISEAPWFGLPSGSWPGLDLGFGAAFWTLLPMFVLVTIVGAVETIGDAIGIQQVSWRKRRATDFRVVQGAVAADGVGNLLSGLMCTVPNTTYSSSVAITELTGVAARSVGVCIGVLFAIVAFLPKVTAVILAVPDTVIATFVLIVLAILFTVGMRIVVRSGMDQRTGLMVGLSFWVGHGFQNQQIFADYFGETARGILGNGMTSGFLAAILMMLVMNLATPKRKRLRTKLGKDSLPEILAFLKEFGRDIKLSPESQQRLSAAGEETVLSLAQDEVDGDERDLLVVAQRKQNAVELELVASREGENIEDRLALVGQWAEQWAERDVSLRLLRHYARSVNHQQYHDIDVVTVVVDAT